MIDIKAATKAQAHDLAHLINLAGEGLPEFLWRGMVQNNESAMDVGARRAAREEGGFSYTNARVCVENDELMGMVISYCQPNPYEIDDLSNYAEPVKPLVLLEAKAPGSWYINAIATYERYRGKGVARRLLQEAKAQALSEGFEVMSLIVASENRLAKRLYEYLGYATIATEPVTLFPGCLHGGNWELMVKAIG